MFFDKKSSKCALALTKFAAVFMSVIVLCLITGAVIDLQAKDVTLVMIDAFADTEKTQELTTRQNTVSEFLEENDITLGEFDRLSMLMEDELYSGARIIIRKGRTFTLNIDGNIEIITTTKKTVREAFEEAGLTLSGTSPDGRLIETVELSERPFHVGVQYHPEFKSRPNKPHPLFKGFVGAAFEKVMSQK